MKTSLLFSSYPFITSEKVTLTRITELDLDRLWEILGDEENFRFCPTGALASPRECEAWLRRSDRYFREGRAVTLGIYPNGEDVRLAGFLEIGQIDREVEAVSLQVMLHRDKTGLGYGSSAVRACAGYLMGTVGVHRIQACVLPIHYRAMQLLERCGFVKEGTIREGFLWPDKGLVDLTVYSLLPTDLKPKKAGGPAYHL